MKISKRSPKTTLAKVNHRVKTQRTWFIQHFLMLRVKNQSGLRKVCLSQSHHLQNNAIRKDTLLKLQLAVPVNLFK